MKPTAILSSLFLAAATQALPTITTTSATSSQRSFFTAHVLAKGHSINDRTIHASNTGFWIGNDTTAVCMYASDNNGPTIFKACSQPTLLISGGGSLAMGSEVPGGQFSYIGPFGALRFTLAHLENMSLPPGSFDSGFSQGVVDGRLLLNPPNGATWQACPVDGVPEVHSVFADLGKFDLEGCVEFEMVLNNATEPDAEFYYE